MSIISSPGKLCCHLLLFALGSAPALADYFYVGDFQTDAITRYDSDGYTSTFGHTVSGPEDFVIGPDGSLYAAISKTVAGPWTWGNLIQRFDQSGQSSRRDIPGLDNPYSLAFDRTGNLYVANASAKNILKINPQGQASVFATTDINASVGLAVDSHGTLYGAFGGKSQIVRWDAQGHESVFADVSSCYDLAFDSQDHLYAASNLGSGMIYRFDALGNATPFAPGLTDDLAFDSHDELYALFSYQSGIVKFDAQGNASWFLNTSSYSVGFAIEVIPEPAPMALLVTALGCGVAAAAAARQPRLPRRRGRV